MRIHHLDCATLCPIGGTLLPWVFPRKIVCHCLLIETAQRLILVDTGLGTRDLLAPSRLGLTGWALGPVLDPAQTAVAQVRALGFAPEDVTDVIPTHLDLDHAGGIQDFPKARVHVAQAELDAARARATFVTGQRYRPAQLEGDIRWQPFKLGQGTSWRGFEHVQPLVALPPEVLLVSLPGHTHGHVGVAIDDGGRWRLHAGDAYYHRRELASPSLGLRAFQRVVHLDAVRAAATQAQLQALAPEVEVFCSHDPDEYARASAARASQRQAPSDE